MSLPSAEALFAAVDATWAPARRWQAGGFTLREGRGGGKRVSAATSDGATTDFGVAADAMRAAGQAPLFMIRPDDGALDAALAAAGYILVDPVIVLAAPIARVARPADRPLAAISGDAPLAMMREIWATGGIGPGRLSVMARVDVPKTYVMGRLGDRAVGCAFAAVSAGIGMVHALEVAPSARGQGVAASILAISATWAQEQGAGFFSVVTTQANRPAQALFFRQGMRGITKYHYRQLKEAP